MTDADTDRLLRELQAEWGQVYVAYKGPDYYEGQQCTIRNTTDEGLPTGVERQAFMAATFTEALDRAHAAVVTGDADVDERTPCPECGEPYIGVTMWEGMEEIRCPNCKTYTPLDELRGADDA